jgi:hypothetical protein
MHANTEWLARPFLLLSRQAADSLEGFDTRDLKEAKALLDELAI